MERCIGLSISDEEINFINNLQLNQEKFIHARNELLVKIFGLFFQVYADKYANNQKATVKIAGGIFQRGIMEYWASVPETEKVNMQNLGVAINYAADLESSPANLYFKVSGKNFDTLLPDQQAEIKVIVNTYVNEVADFFKQHLPKLI